MDHRLMDILACPVCKSKLYYGRTHEVLICKADRLAFPIVDDIPVMIENKARSITQEEVEKWVSE